MKTRPKTLKEMISSAIDIGDRLTQANTMVNFTNRRTNHIQNHTQTLNSEARVNGKNASITGSSNEKLSCTYPNWKNPSTHITSKFFNKLREETETSSSIQTNSIYSSRYARCFCYCLH